MRDQSAFHSFRGGQIRWRIQVFGPSFASDNCYSRQLKGHAGWVRSAAFSPNGKRVVTASYDNTARIWDVIVRGDDLRERVCAGTLVGLAQEFTDAELEDPILRGIDKDDFVACNPCLGRGPLSLDSAADTILALVASRCLCETDHEALEIGVLAPRDRIERLARAKRVAVSHFAFLAGADRFGGKGRSSHEATQADINTGRRGAFGRIRARRSDFEIAQRRERSVRTRLKINRSWSREQI